MLARRSRRRGEIMFEALMAKTVVKAVLAGVAVLLVLCGTSARAQDYERAMALADSLWNEYTAAVERHFPWPDDSTAMARFSQCIVQHGIAKDSLSIVARTVLAENGIAPTEDNLLWVLTGSAAWTEHYVRPLCLQRDPPGTQWWLREVERAFWRALRDGRIRP
jgi:hypothetical protein